MGILDFVISQCEPMDALVSVFGSYITVIGGALLQKADQFQLGLHTCVASKQPFSIKVCYMDCVARYMGLLTTSTHSRGHSSLPIPQNYTDRSLYCKMSSSCHEKRQPCEAGILILVSYAPELCRAQVYLTSPAQQQEALVQGMREQA